MSGQDPMLAWMGRLKEQVDIRYQAMGQMHKDANLTIDIGKSVIENWSTAADGAEDDQQVAIFDLVRHEVRALQDAVFAMIDQIIDCEQGYYLIECHVGAGRFDPNDPWISNAHLEEYDTGGYLERCANIIQSIKTWVNEGDLYMAGRMS